MSKFWSKVVKETEPYIPGEQPKDRKYIKLNTNENPYPPSPRVIEAIKEATDEKLKLYPDPESEDAKLTIANYYGMKKEQVFLSNGSDELLGFIFLAFFNPDNPILFPDITYSFYKVYAQLFNIDYRLVELSSDFSLPIDKFFNSNGGIIFPNPNAPTGKIISLAAIEEILKNNPEQVVVIDEAYIDFGGDSAVSLVHKYPNLLVVQTFSKSRSLAGLRIGFALGQEHLIEGLERIKNSFNSYTLDRLAQIGAVESIKDEVYFQRSRLMVIETRERVSRELQKIGFNVLESRSNFIFITTELIEARVLFDRLYHKGIIVRHFNQPRIDNFLRVTIGTDEEMNYFLEVVREIIKDKGIE